MLEALRRRQPGRPVGRILWWHFLHMLCYLWVTPCYRYRAWGTHNIPDEGPVLLASNHQSFLDPILVGLACHHRQFYAMARSSLFRGPVGWIIRSLNAVPIERGEADLAAIRKCIDVLKQGQALLVFPEGTRTLDGRTGTFAPGTMLIIKRAKARVVPVAVEGSFAAWPKGRKLPRAAGTIGVMYGTPVAPETLAAMGPEGAMKFLRDRVEEMRQELARRLASRGPLPAQQPAAELF